LPGLRLSRPAASLSVAVLGAAAAGALMWAANPPADLGPLAFVALIPLLAGLRRAGPGRGALLGMVFGLVYFGLLLRWLMLFGVIAEWPLVIVQAVYLAGFGAVAASVLRRRAARPAGFGSPIWCALLVAAAWVAADWLRGTWPLGGFTWGGLGYTQHANGLLLPIASVAGVWAVTFVVVLVNVLLMEAGIALWSGRRPRAILAVGIATAAALLPAAIPLPVPGGRPLDVAVVQGSVPRALVSDRLLQTSEVAASHIRLHRTLAGDPPDLAVWPENALAEDPAADSVLGSAVSAAVREVGAPALIGALRALPDGGYANQTLLYDGSGSILSRYTKVHLVPFGEYVPWRGLFGWAERYRGGNVDLVPGTTVHDFRVAGTIVGTPICFENTFPDLFRRFVHLGASVMIVTTNDSSYLLTEASREHTIFSQLRAVETGRWVVQAAISGESALVDPHGRVVARTGLFQRTILRASVPTGSAMTLYVRFGDWFPAACALASVVLIGVGIARRVRRRWGRGGPADAGRGDCAGGRAARAGRPLAPVGGGADPRALVVLPTYDERATIEEVLAGVLATGPNVDALVVDDNSPDGTAGLVASIAERTGRVRLIRRAGKQGLASAYVAGFAEALAGGYDVVVEMDADLSHRPEDLPALIAGSARFDLTIGSRYVPGGAVSNWSRARLALSKAGNAYARAALGLPVRDATSGFRAYRRAALEALLKEGVTADGYGFQIELVRRAHRMGYTIGEVPITFREREHGHSKISRSIVLEALGKVAVWGVQDRFGGRRRRGAGEAADAPAPHRDAAS
jgi:apolipoprotein N-acyltransferase